MRSARIVSNHPDAWLHLTARAVGYHDEVIFDPAMRSQILRIFHEVAALSTVEILDFAIMGNHLHVVARPGKAPSTAGLIRRYEAYYENRPAPYGDLTGNATGLETFKANVGSVSYFMRTLMLRTSAWFNSHGPRRRTGSIWTQRHKSTLIQGRTALWSLLQHIALNPVRVGESADPADYPFSAYGLWMQHEVHPFPAVLTKAMTTMKPDFTGSADAALDLFIEELIPFLSAKAPQRLQTDNGDRLVLVSARKSRRTWTDGAVLGNQDFVRRHGKLLPGFQPGKKLGGGVLADGTPIYALRRLRQAANLGGADDGDND